MSDSVQPHRWQPTRLCRPWDSPGKNTGVGCPFLLQCLKVKSESEVAQSCLTLRDPMDCSLPGSSIHGISQARVHTADHGKSFPALQTSHFLEGRKRGKKRGSQHLLDINQMVFWTPTRIYHVTGPSQWTKKIHSEFPIYTGEDTKVTGLNNLPKA